MNENRNSNHADFTKIINVASRGVTTACAIVFVWHLPSLAQLVSQVQTGQINVVEALPRIVAPLCLILGATIGYRWLMIGRVLLIFSAGLSLIAATSDSPTPAKFWTIVVLSLVALAFIEYRRAKERVDP